MHQFKNKYANYLSINLMEILGNKEPTEEQISLLESILLKTVVFHDIFFNEQLSNREIGCLYWAALGKTSNETAKLLKIQPGTVEQHRKTIKKKLSCQTLAEAVFRGIQLGYLPVCEIDPTDEKLFK